MQLLRKYGKLKTAGILAHLDRHASNAAPKSVLRHMLEKGHPLPETRSKALSYQLKPSRNKSLKNLTRSQSDIFCGNHQQC